MVTYLFEGGLLILLFVPKRWPAWQPGDRDSLAGRRRVRKSNSNEPSSWWYRKVGGRWEENPTPKPSPRAEGYRRDRGGRRHSLTEWEGGRATAYPARHHGSLTNTGRCYNERRRASYWLAVPAKKKNTIAHINLTITSNMLHG